MIKSSQLRCRTRADHKVRGVASLLMVCGSFVPMALMAQQPAATTSSSATTLANLGWLAGVWHAPFQGGQAEDTYEAVNNGEVLSTFKLVVNGKTTRYELRSIREKDGKFVFNELAFGPELKPLDPLADRVLLSSDDSHLNFDGLVLTHTGKNTMHVDLTVHLPDGSTKVFKIDYTRVATFAPATN